MRTGNSFFIFIFVIIVALHGQAYAGKIDAIATDEGQVAWFSNDAALPLFSVRLSFEHGGIAYDPPGKEGLAVFASRMMTEGAGDLSATAFNEALENKAIGLDAGVDEDRLMISLDGLSEHKKTAFDLLKKVLHAPRFDVADIERIRSEMLIELKQMEEDPNYIAGREFDKIAFKGHPYSDPAYGTKESLGSITVEDLKNYFAEHVIKAGITLSLSGDISRNEAQKFLSAAIDGLPAPKTEFKPLPEIELATAGIEKIPYHSPQTVVAFAMPGVARDDPQFYAAYLMNYSLGGGTLTARLGNEIRRKHGLSYYVSSYLSIDQASHILKGGMAVRTEKADEAIDLLKKTLAKALTEKFTDQEVKAARDYVIGSFPMGIDTNREFAGYMQMMQWFKLGIDYIDKRSFHFKSVTTADVNTVAKRLLDPQKLLVVAVGGKK